MASLQDKQRTKHWQKVAVLLSGLFFIASCSNSLEDSTDVATSSIYADFSVEQVWDDVGAVYNLVFEARLKLGGPNSYILLTLVNGESLTINDGGAEQTMQSDGYGGYRYTFVDPGVETSYTIALNRTDYVDAPLSTITMPASFVIDTPVDTDSFSVSTDPISIAWSPSSTVQENLYIQVYPATSDLCVTAHNSPVTVAPYEVPATTMSVTSTPCSATARLFQEVYGAVDSAYGKGGRFAATRFSDVTFSVTP